MAEPRFFLVVRFWVAPQVEARVLKWLDGWSGYAMIYAIATPGDFERYDSNRALMAKFARERAPFESQMRIERFAGEVEP